MVGRLVVEFGNGAGCVGAEGILRGGVGVAVGEEADVGVGFIGLPRDLVERACVCAVQAITGPMRLRNLVQRTFVCEVLPVRFEIASCISASVSMVNKNCSRICSAAFWTLAGGWFIRADAWISCLHALGGMGHQVCRHSDHTLFVSMLVRGLLHFGVVLHEGRNFF